MLFKKLNIHKLWQKKGVINYLLLPLVCIWILGGVLRKIKNTYKSELFIICIGNINIGGAGKTPTAIFLGSKLKELGYKACFLTKGYGGNLKNISWVRENHDPTEVGDEALLLAKYLPTLVTKNISEALCFLEKEDFDIVITDDGFQNPTFYKDFKILVVNSHYAFGNGMIFPSGPLRQSMSTGLKSANYIVLLEGANDYIINLSQKYHLGLVKGKYIPLCLDRFIDKKFLAFCGIGIPDKFKRTLDDFDIKVEKFIAYPDHYFYSKKDIQYLINEADQRGLVLLTTEKDYVKIPLQYQDKILSFNINLGIDDSDKLIKNVINAYESKIKNEKKA